MWLLILLCACALLLLLTLTTSARSVWHSTRNNDEVLQRVEVLAREGRVEEALEVAHGLGGAASSAVIAGLTRRDEAEAEQGIREVGRAHLAAFRGKLRLFEWIGAAALLGPAAAAVDLLGVGSEGLDALRETGELYAFLALTAWGLGIAILATLGRFWLISRLRRLAVEMEKGALVVYNTAR